MRVSCSTRTLESDFVDTPITITISPGDTSALVSIPIIDDNAVEKDERFDVVLQAQGNGATIGSSGQATVIIGNDDGELGEHLFILICYCYINMQYLQCLLYTVMAVF